MPTVITRYVCGICTTEYSAEQDAAACEARGAPNYRLAVGDIMLGRSGYGWYDGDKRWIANYAKLLEVTKRDGRPCPNGNRNCFDPCCTYQFYYVVTHLDVYSLDRHRAEYHVATKAMSGAQGHRAGVTYDSGHITLRKVARPPAYIVRDSQDLLGEKVDPWCLL